MNAFDFDNTILRGDSTARFIAYCFKRYPLLWLQIPAQAGNALLFLTRLREKQRFKQTLFRMLRMVPDIDAAIEAFWDENMPRIKPWYLAMHREDDVVISASPEFLLEPAMKRLGIRHLMASPVDRLTGQYRGLNCHGEEKVRRFAERFPGARVERFYSDSLSDTPMARLADEAFLVKGDQLLPWPKDALK